MVLRIAGHQVSVATDGESGLRLIRESMPDVVVSDIRMPGIDGHKLVSILRADPATAMIPVLLMSGHGHADKNSCDAFLAKPFPISELLAAVQQLAKRRTGV
jgi:CheY-like chemotaxis protein